MKKFQPYQMAYNADIINELGNDINALITVLERQTISEAYAIHYDEYESFSEYAESVNPLFDSADDRTVQTAISFTARFFYSKGLQDSVQIKDRLFMRSTDR